MVVQQHLSFFVSLWFRWFGRFWRDERPRLRGQSRQDLSRRLPAAVGVRPIAQQDCLAAAGQGPDTRAVDTRLNQQESVPRVNGKLDGPVPHKDFLGLYEKMSGKGESASEAHPGTPSMKPLFHTKTFQVCMRK